MSKLAERNNCISQITDLIKASAVVEALIVTGDQNTESGDLRIAAVVQSGGNLMQAYSRINYMLMSELRPVGSKAISRDEYCLIKRYDTAEGVSVLLKVCDGGSIRAEEWWRPIFDMSGICGTIPSEPVAEDRLCDLTPPEDEGQEPDSFDDMPLEDDTHDEQETAEETEKEPEEEPAEPTDLSDQPSESEQAAPAQSSVPLEQTDEYWDYVSESLREACEAVSENALIRANTILNTLRHMLVELICVNNGYTENFDRMIDRIECPEKSMLMMTFPARHDQRAFLSALGAASSIFDRYAQ